MGEDVIVVGEGIAGLSCAVALAEGGRRVAVVADAPAEATVSAVAGGLWFPYGVDAGERSLALCRATYDRYESLLGDPAAGVTMVDHLHLDGEDPWWAAAMPAGRVRRARPDELPAGYPAGWVARVPLVESGRHLAFLRRRAAELGVAFRRERVASLAAIAERGAAVVNCAGLGARELCGDAAVAPVRGQVVHLRPHGGPPPRSVADPGPALAYVLPRPDVWIAGGTADPDEDPAPDSARREAILAACRAIAPEIDGAEVLGDHAGLRPVRAGGFRLEAEGPVVHCYGHGGAGWTLAWGCAASVRELAD